MIARVFDSKHQAYFCLPKPCPFGECGEDSCCPSSFSPALCEATVLISSAPHISPTFSGPLWEVDAGQCCSWRLQPVSGVQPCSFRLPPSQPQFSPFPGSCPHLPRGLPARKLSSFSFWFFLPPSVRCFGALLEAEWSGSFSFFPIRHLFLESICCYSTVWMPCDLLLWDTNQNVKWNLVNEKHTVHYI